MTGMKQWMVGPRFSEAHECSSFGVECAGQFEVPGNHMESEAPGEPAVLERLVDYVADAVGYTVVKHFH